MHQATNKNGTQHSDHCTNNHPCIKTRASEVFEKFDERKCLVWNKDTVNVKKSYIYKIDR